MNALNLVRCLVILVMSCAVASVSLVGFVQPVMPAFAGDGVYTEEQANRGAALYNEQCIACHEALAQLIPGMAALLADYTFRARWENRSLGELFELVQIEMPQDAPGSLSSQQTVDLIAYILSGNKLPTGDAPLAVDVEALTQIRFTR